MSIINGSQFVTYEDEKLKIVFDKKQGGSIVEWYWKRMAPSYNICRNKSGMWLNTSHEGISDGTNKGAYQGTEKNTRVTLYQWQDKGRVIFNGEMHFGDRLNEIGPFLYWTDFTFHEGWFEETITLQVYGPGAGKRFYAINQAMDFDQSFNKALTGCNQVWLGRSRSWSLKNVSSTGEFETGPELNQVSTLYKTFGDMFPNNKLAWGGLANGNFGIILVLPDTRTDVSIGWNAGYNTLTPNTETPGNTFVRSIETANLYGDGDRRFLQTNLNYDNPILVDKQIIKWRVCFFPFEGPDIEEAKNWIRSSGFNI